MLLQAFIITINAYIWNLTFDWSTFGGFKGSLKYIASASGTRVAQFVSFMFYIHYILHYVINNYWMSEACTILIISTQMIFLHTEEFLDVCKVDWLIIANINNRMNKDRYIINFNLYLATFHPEISSCIFHHQNDWSKTFIIYWLIV